jgi:hypothetical protein
MKAIPAVKGAFAAQIDCLKLDVRAKPLAAIFFLASSIVASAQEVQKIPGHARSQVGSVAGTIRDQDGIAVAEAQVQLRTTPASRSFKAASNGEGIYRLNGIPAGDYEVTVTADNAIPASGLLTVSPAKLEVLDFQLQRTIPPLQISPDALRVPGARTTQVPPVTDDSGSFPIFRGPQPENPPDLGPVEVVPTYEENFGLDPYRWTEMLPTWRRYGSGGDHPYVIPHWYDPFNRNRLKGDVPIFGQRWFLNITGTSLTQTEVRRLPTPSNVAAESPGSRNFFGRGEQAIVDQSFRLSMDLFRGDTSFQPVEFRVRFTPEFDLNFLQTRERGIVNADVRSGTNRFDTHVGVQEAFFEAKIHDLSPNFDFVSVRTGIQGFSSDFRGFIFVDEDPAVRVFGNLRSNRINYNLAYFYLLEKDTNSGLNTFEPRHQQVGIANVYIQDAFAKGYTTEFSFHYNYDQGGIHYDKNGFLVRPAPIGSVVMSNGIPEPHSIRSYYLGWTGNGHIGGLNISNAFYEALGTDSFSSIAGRSVHINAQMGALELSKDRDWLRYRASVFWASGDTESRVGPSRSSGTARGFDSILDDTQFAGGQFSFFDREGIRLLGTGVALTTPFSLLPSLRSSKDEGQSNFVNPGIRIYNVGIDADLTPKLRAFANINYLQFDRTETLKYLLFQSNVHRGIGTDSGIGIAYRPPLTENMVLTAGVSALVPDTGLRNIYNSRVLVSAFVKLRIQF